jgi:pimeloyl-ACP methyl ester carboxylesterase
MKTVKQVMIDGQQVAYRKAGRGPAILLLHGLGRNSASWEPHSTHSASSPGQRSPIATSNVDAA